MEGQYSGVDILEALESAHNYNDYLTRLIRESTESKDLTDFGAGTGPSRNVCARKVAACFVSSLTSRSENV